MEIFKEIETLSKWTKSNSLSSVRVGRFQHLYILSKTEKTGLSKILPAIQEVFTKLIFEGLWFFGNSKNQKILDVYRRIGLNSTVSKEQFSVLIQALSKEDALCSSKIENARQAKASPKRIQKQLNLQKEFQHLKQQLLILEKAKECKVTSSPQDPEIPFPQEPEIPSPQEPVENKSTEYSNQLSISLNFQNCPGRHTIKSPVVGTRSEELLAVQKAIRSLPVLANLQNSIYSVEGSIHIIPLNKKDEADEVARALFLDYISKYAAHGCTEQNIVKWCYTGLPGAASNKTLIYDVENEWNTWCVCAYVERRNGACNEAYGHYLPPHVVAYHELMHIEETPLQAKVTHQGQNGDELLTTIKTYLLLDHIYKKIHGLNESTEVDYGIHFEINGNKIGLGKFANFYREQELKHEKLYLALISSDSISFLKNGKV